MEALALIAHARSFGYRIEARDGALVVNGPLAGHEQLIAELMAAKPALIAVLQATAIPPDHESWYLIDGKWHSPAAADLHRRSVPFVTGSSDACYRCGATRHWRLRADCPWVCDTCHASGRPADKVEWKGLTTPGPTFESDPPRGPLVPVDAPNANAEVSRG